jgi:GT2 family glycosyltransferase
MLKTITSQNSRALLILGMHRSGTSALTRILNLLGVELGSQLLPSHATNETGFWEHIAIVRANEQILQLLDSSWFDTAPLPEKWWTFKTLAPLRQYLNEVLHQEFAHCPLWAIKDPRLCRLLPFWLSEGERGKEKGGRRKALSGGEALHFIIIIRHPLEVAQSLEVRDGLSYNTSLRLWLEYVLASVENSQGYSRVFVTYDELLQDWRATIHKIAQTFDIKWLNSVESVSAEVEAFLNPTLKHHEVSRFQKENKLTNQTINEELLAWSHAVYQALSRVAKGDNEQLNVLNSIHALLHRAPKHVQHTSPVQIHLLIHLRNRKQAQYLTNTLNALRAQHDNHWYLSIIADFSNTENLALCEFPNVRWLQIPSNHQVITTINHEISIINAQWIALISAGDSFESDLFSLCIQHIQNFPDLQFIYVDEDVFNPDINLTTPYPPHSDSIDRDSLSLWERVRVRDEYDAPQFKPDFNLDLLRSMPYLGHFCLIRREALQKVGGYASYIGLENEDIAFKLFERYGESAFGHIAKLFYHHLTGKKFSLSPGFTWGYSHSTPTGLRLLNFTEKFCKSQYQKILQQHLQRQGIHAEVKPSKIQNIYWIDYALQHNALVSIIIATRNGHASLQRCLDSLLKLTAYPYYEILIVDNHSDDLETLAYLENLKKEETIRRFSYHSEATSAELNNFAAQQARGDYLLFLNDDTEIIEADWLQRLLALNQRQEVGIVAPRLLDGQKRVIHAGFILGMGSVGIAGQINQGLAENDLGYMGRAQATQNFSAVSDNCLMIKKTLYQTVDGMDTQTNNVLFHDVDLCLKVRQTGEQIIWTPNVTLLQHGVGSLVRNRQQKIDNAKISQEVTAIYQKWLPQLSADPAYNPNLCLNDKEWQLETQVNVPWVGTIWNKTWQVSSPRLDLENAIDPKQQRHDSQLPITHYPLPKIVAFPHDSWGVGEYRVRAPLRALQQAGLIDYALMPNDDVGKIPTVAELERMQTDTLLLHNTLHDKQLNALQQYRLFNRCFKVFGQDDLIYALPKTNPYYKTNYKDIKQRVYRAISLCDRLIVTTEPLAEAYRHLSNDIRIIPNYLEYARWKDLSPKRYSGRKPRIGWAGAAQHLGDLKIIEPLVKTLAHQVEWIFLGICPEELKPYIHEYYGMVPFADYPAKLASLNLDLALAPLEHNAFNEAKSHLRLLEYGILGYPVVCSDIYPYQHAPVKRVANTETAWREAVQERLHDLETTAKEGNTLKEWVLNHWLLENNLTTWGTALNVMTVPLDLDSLGTGVTQERHVIHSNAERWNEKKGATPERHAIHSFAERWNEKNQIIFLLGCEDSGSELLAKILCQQEAFDEWTPDHLHQPLFEIQIPQLWTEKKSFPKEVPPCDPPSPWERTKVRALIVAGIPANLGRALSLQQQFPDAYFIHIVRNGYAVALDIYQNVQQEYGMTPLLLHRAARQWRRSLELLQQDIPKLRHFFEIHYEELLDKPDAVLTNIFDFLNIEDKSNTEDLIKNFSLPTLAYQQTKRLAQIRAEQQAVIKNGL